jgi:hypothetical protein
VGHCNRSPLEKKVFNSVSGTIPLLLLTAVIKQFGRIFPRTLKMKGWGKYVELSGESWETCPAVS